MLKQILCQLVAEPDDWSCRPFGTHTAQQKNLIGAARGKIAHI